MKKILIFSLCTVMAMLSVTVCVYLLYKPDIKIPISNSSVNDSTDSSTNNITNNSSSDNAEQQQQNIITEKLVEVPTICQYPQLPTGCESVAATMVLQYYGVDISAGEFVISWLEYSENFYTLNGSLYGPDPNQVFAGNPFTEGSYGCFATPIVNAINRNSMDCTAQKITNKSLEELCLEYINNDKPLLIWATMNMKKSYEGRKWRLADGSLFTWPAREHCLVLVGYDENSYFLNDPMTGTTVSYEKSLVEKRFKELGGQAVYISPKV